MNDVFGKKLGQYILLEQLGEGGMAKVYNALDSRVEGNVAIKVILPSKRTSQVFLQQFEQEAKALANLTHTNIVKVLNYGIQDGQPYLVMEYVSGGTLREVMHQKMPWQTAAAVLAPIARALDYVHRQQIVHRDVKPSNILLHEDFRPMLSDFGILKLLEGKDEKADSAIGAGIGTPEYMPPEQGLGKEVDFRADIYSLGLVFYEMVTGQKPFTADSPMAVVIKHVTDKLPLPTRVDKNIPKYVERVILRAVQKNPKNRYISMSHFADALELIALGDKASPQKINRVSREKEKRQRSTSIILLSILLLVMVLGTSSLFAYNYFKEANAPSVVPPIIIQETPTPNNSPTQTSISLPTEVSIVTPEANPISQLTLLGTPIANSQNSQFNEIARWGIGGVNVVRWSPDGKTIALGTTAGIFLYDYDSQMGELDLFIDTKFNVLEMTFNPLGNEIAAGSSTGIVNTWNSVSGELLKNFSFTPSSLNQFAPSGEVTVISYSSDGKNIAIGYKNGVINYFPSNQGAIVLDNFPSVEDLIISADNRFIYASNGGLNIEILDIQTGKEKNPLSNPGAVNNLRISTDRQLMLAGGNGNSVYLWFWDTVNAKWEQIIGFSNLGGRVTDFDFSYDNKYVAIGLNTGTIKVFETPDENESKTLQPLSSFDDFSDQILSIAFSPNESTLASGNHEDGLKLRNASKNEDKPFSLDQSMAGIDEIYLSNDGLWLATAHADGLIRVWNVNEAQEAYPPFEGYLPKGIPFSPDNRFLTFIYSPGKNKEDIIRIMELKTQKIVAELPGYTRKSFVQFTYDTKLLTVGDAYSANIWDVATWEQLNTKGGPTAGCGQYFTPQSNLLAIISNAGILYTNDSTDQKIEALCSVKPQGAILTYYFYEEHRMIFVIGTGDVGIWDFGPRERLRDIESDTPYLQSSQTFLAGDQESGWFAYVFNKNIYIKNINGSAADTVIEEQEDFPYRVALLPGKNLMVLGSKYGSIHIWTMP